MRLLWSWVVMVALSVSSAVPSTHADGLFTGGDVGRNPPDTGALDPDRPASSRLRTLEAMTVDELQDARRSLEALADSNPVFGFLQKRVRRALTEQGVTDLVVPAGEADGWEVKMTDKGTPRRVPTLPVDLDTTQPTWYNTASDNLRNFWVIRNQGNGRRVRLANTLTGREIVDEAAYNENVGLPHSFHNELANTDNNLGGITPMENPVGMGAPVLGDD